MTWTQGKLGYYADFLIVPVLIGGALPSALSTWWALVTLPAGYLTWTFAEYMIHRYVFHRAMRKEHWMHHVRPVGYVSAPWYLTLSLHIALFCSAFLLGWTGVFVGIEASYWVYIHTHDRIHHSGQVWIRAFDFPWGSWIAWRAALHDVHHRGIEVNFGIVHSWFDHLLGTHCHPLNEDRARELQRQRQACSRS